MTSVRKFGDHSYDSEVCPVTVCMLTHKITDTWEVIERLIPGYIGMGIFEYKCS